jgi:hypothetical protein
MGFLDNQVWAGFSANDENDYDPQEESYRNSVSDIIRSIIGNCVPHDYTRYDLSRFFKDQTAPIIAVTYHYKHEGKFVNPKRIYHPNQPNLERAVRSTVKTAIGKNCVSALLTCSTRTSVLTQMNACLTLCTLSTPNQHRGSTTHRIRLPQVDLLLLCLRQQLP